MFTAYLIVIELHVELRLNNAEKTICMIKLTFLQIFFFSELTGLPSRIVKMVRIASY